MCVTAASSIITASEPMTPVPGGGVEGKILAVAPSEE
jgi:hypothetical protein